MISIPAKHIVQIFRYNTVCLRIYLNVPLQTFGISIISALQAFDFTVHNICTQYTLFFCSKKNYLHVWQFFSMSNGICDDFYFEMPNKDKMVCWFVSFFFCCCMCVYLNTCLSGIRKASFFDAIAIRLVERRKIYAHACQSNANLVSVKEKNAVSILEWFCTLFQRRRAWKNNGQPLVWLLWSMKFSHQFLLFHQK